MSEASSFCEQCGTMLEPGVQFCEECGHGVDRQLPSEQQRVPRLLVVVIGAVVGLAIGGIVALIVAGVFDGDQDAAVQVQPVGTQAPIATEPPGQLATPTERRPSGPDGCCTLKQALENGLVGLGLELPVGNCGDSSLEPGTFCVCFHQMVDDSTASFLVGQTFSEIFDALHVERLPDGTYIPALAIFDAETTLGCTAPPPEFEL